jgi:4-hydroxybenzoate polyprenyltransferase
MILIIDDHCFNLLLIAILQHVLFFLDHHEPKMKDGILSFIKHLEEAEPRLQKTLKGLVKLTRFDEYVYFVVITTLVGVASAGGGFNWRFFVLIPANWLAVGFAFMINDVEDAPDDALSKHKSNRNPVSAGLIPPKTARIATFIVGAFSAALFALLGLWPFIFGLITLILGYLYSFRGIRLKTIAFFDILSHGLMLAGLQFLCGYFTYANRLEKNWFWPFTFLMAVSIYGKLYNEIRDIQDDRQANLQHTAVVLGERSTQILMFIMLGFGIFAGAVSLIVIEIIPIWVFLLMALLSILFIIPKAIKIRRNDSSMVIQASLQKPFERAAALALLLQYLLPWLAALLKLNFL